MSLQRLRKMLTKAKALGSTTEEVDKVYVGDSDGIYFGADQDASIVHDGTTGVDFNIADNDAAALDINEGGTSYIKCVTTNGSEAITLGKATTVSGALTASDALRLSVGTLAANGSTAADAIANAAVTKVFTQVTGCDNAKGIALPTAVAGDVRIVKASTAGSTVQVYPQTNAQINALTANSAYNTAQAGSVAFIAYNTALWYTIPLAG